MLRELALAGGSSTIADISRELSVDPAAISRPVAGLQCRGLVARESDDRDGRRRPVVLTDEGQRLMAALRAEAHRREALLTADLDQRSIETAMQVLRALRDALQTTAREPRCRTDTRRPP